VKNGLAHVFAPHATGVIVLTEYEPGLLGDIRELLDRLIPRGAGYRHPVNAHSHLRSMFLCPDRTIPIVDGRLALGTWQSIVYIEVDTHGRRRENHHGSRARGIGAPAGSQKPLQTRSEAERLEHPPR